MSGVPAEQDETTDYRTTRQGTGQKGSLEGHASACPRRAEARPSAASGGASNGLVQGSAGVRLAGIHNGTGRGQRASAFAQGYGATRRSKGQKAEGRSRNDEAA